MRCLFLLLMLISMGLNAASASEKDSPKIKKKSKRSKKAKIDPLGKKLFDANCLACHDPLKALVGPTLYEINEIYSKNIEGIVSWAKKPGRKRSKGIAMPAMAHVPDKDLKLIADYMLAAGSRVRLKELRKANIFKEKLGKIQRTFMPNSSVASFAIKFSDHLSLCWDAEKGTTRYIWQGQIDPESHFTGNGKVVPSIQGDVIYKSSDSLFIGLSPKINFLGYKVTDQGLPEFLYKRGNYQFSETLSFNNDNLSWNYKTSGAHELRCKLPKVDGYKTSVSHGEIQGDILILNKSEVNNFTITLSKEK